MILRWSLTVSALAARHVADAVAAQEVCTPDECISGNTSLAVGAKLLYDGNTTILLPGTFTSRSATSSNVSLSTASSVEPAVGFDVSGSLSSSSVSVSFADSGVTLYSLPLFEDDSPRHVGLNQTDSANARSFVLSSRTRATFTAKGARVVFWDSLPDSSQAGRDVASGDLALVDVQSTACSTPCSSAGYCSANGTCACSVGFTGSTCGSCEDGFYGPSCLACPSDCTTCDDGITGSGRCLDSMLSYVNVTTAAVCDCVNGICDGDTCRCTAGWATASNGTLCAVCATGYFANGDDCLACDSTCASCAASTGTCITCKSGLQPDSSDGTRCTTASTALANGTFVECEARTFYDSEAGACIDCNPLCEACHAKGADACLSCREPNVLLGGTCVAIDSSTGACESPSNLTGHWVYSNDKDLCDALPAKCTSGGFDGFDGSSTRADLRCSACLAGVYLYDGSCLSECPSGTTIAADGLSCAACDDGCDECEPGNPSFCTACTNGVALDGACVDTCPSGYFADDTQCLACHPDCATCGPTFDACLSCSSSRPVLSGTTCLATCSSHEYFDTAKSECVECSDTCATCSGASSSECLSCSTTERLDGGTCVAADCAAVVDGFGVCLADLVTSSSSASSSAAILLPWWTIALIIAGVLSSAIGTGWFFWRRRARRKRSLKTAEFAATIDRKEVDKRLAELPVTVAYPPAPSPEPETRPSCARQSFLTTHNPLDFGRSRLKRPVSPRPASASSTSSSRQSSPERVPTPPPAHTLTAANGRSFPILSRNNPFRTALEKS